MAFTANSSSAPHSDTIPDVIPAANRRSQHVAHGYEGGASCKGQGGLRSLATIQGCARAICKRAECRVVPSGTARPVGKPSGANGATLCNAKGVCTAWELRVEVTAYCQVTKALLAMLPCIVSKVS